MAASSWRPFQLHNNLPVSLPGSAHLPRFHLPGPAAGSLAGIRLRDSEPGSEAGDLNGWYSLSSMILENERVLVTGANGFVGSHLVEALLKAGYRVRCMVRRSSDLTFIGHLDVEWAYADVRQPASLHAACQNVSRVCHCAALTRALDWETFEKNNVQGTLALARAAMEANPELKRFLFVSSQAAAGPSAGADDWLDESCPPHPVDWYGKSKWAAEQALLQMAPTPAGAGRDRLPLTIVRPAAVFGPRERDILSYFQLVQRGLSLRLGSGPQKVSLIYIQDLVDLLLLALENDAALGETFFACTMFHSYSDLATAIASSLDRRLVRLYLPQAVIAPMSAWARIQGRLTGRPALLNEQRLLEMRVPFWLCSGEKARRELGFAPKYDLIAAVQETANWYRENGWL
jgi:dihydroflavonol-4-reductase